MIGLAIPPELSKFFAKLARMIFPWTGGVANDFLLAAARGFVLKSANLPA